MGYKSRADEKSWNGANRKVLDAEIASHLVMFERIPNIYGRVEKIGVRVRSFILFKELNPILWVELASSVFVIRYKSRKDGPYLSARLLFKQVI